MQVATLKEYFLSYGDLSSVELEEEPSDYNGVGSETLKNCSACVTFTTRRSAERAFLNGKCWQGKNLKFVWLTCSTSSNEPGNGQHSSAPKSLVDTDQSAETLARTDSQEASASGNGEPENSEINNGTGRVELHEVLQCHSASISGEAESPKCEPSLTSISPEKELTKKDPSQTATSEKEIPKGISGDDGLIDRLVQ